MSNSNDNRKRDTARLVLIVTICLVWAANFAANVFVKEYESPAGIDVAFSLVCGYLLVTYKGRGDDGDNGDDEGNSPREIESSTR